MRYVFNVACILPTSKLCRNMNYSTSHAQPMKLCSAGIRNSVWSCWLSSAGSCADVWGEAVPRSKNACLNFWPTRRMRGCLHSLGLIWHQLLAVQNMRLSCRMNRGYIHPLELFFMDFEFRAFMCHLVLLAKAMLGAKLARKYLHRKCVRCFNSCVRC